MTYDMDNEFGDTPTIMILNEVFVVPNAKEPLWDLLRLGDKEKYLHMACV